MNGPLACRLMYGIGAGLGIAAVYLFVTVLEEAL